jgi:hypothetical protein
MRLLRLAVAPVAFAVAAAARAVAPVAYAVAAVALAGGSSVSAQGAPASLASNSGGDAAHIDDLFIFPVTDPTLVAIAITVGNPFPRGSVAPAFDPRVLYAIHIDNVGDFQDHLTLQFLADGATPAGPRQRIVAYGPSVPTAGSDASLLQSRLGSAFVNQTTILDKGVTFFAGLRRDPFFFDAVQFARVRSGRASCFRTAGHAENAYAGDNVLALVFTAPKTLIAPRNRGRINVWATASTSRAGTGPFAPKDRAGRPHIAEFFGGDVRSFALAAPPGGAGRSAQTGEALGRIFVTDDLEADIESPNGAGYLGIEVPATPVPTATPAPSPSPVPPAEPSPAVPSAAASGPAAPSAPPGSKKGRPTPQPTPYRPFGGRGIADPAMAVNLKAIYGSLLAQTNIVPDDGRETPCLTSDGTTAPKNLGATDFPYLDAPL